MTPHARKEKISCADPDLQTFAERGVITKAPGADVFDVKAFYEANK